MKATLWICSFVTTILFFAHNVSALHYPDSRYLQENLLIPKRSKPSLSIVNPLDTLRQRIMLEMSRRQMREKAKQIESNKALFQQIGKRSGDTSYLFPFDDTFGGDIVRNQNNNRQTIETNTGQKYITQGNNNKNIPRKLQTFAESSSSNGQDKNNLLENDVDGNDIDLNEYIPNDDYRLRYVYSMQQNRYNHP